MSKVLYVYSRHRDFGPDTEDRLSAVCKALTPDNVTSASRPGIFVRGKTACAVTHITSGFHESNLSVFSGFLYEKPGLDWSTPGHCYPDGNYAMFRGSDDEIEVVSDAVASRTIWYYHDDTLFAASTSQRAIILFLGEFVFDERVIPWILSTGSLGPELSWDKRLTRLQADSSVRLDKRTWQLAVHQNPVVFSETIRTKEEHKALLISRLRQTIGNLESLDFGRWALPLSGGYDSRAILCFISECLGTPKDLKAVTWGLESSVHENGNDAQVAAELARSFGLRHAYYHTDISPEPIETVINRYLVCSEGRIDHLGGYADGMEIWRKLHDENIEGVIRGEQGFGWHQVTSELSVKLTLGCAVCADFENLKQLSETFGLPPQPFPPAFERREDESLEAWRDRLYHTFRIPGVLAALSDIKLAYVELINPLLSRAIISAVRTLPDNLRTGKFLFKEIVREVGAGVPFANKGANAHPKDILRNKPIVELMKREIDSPSARQFLGTEFIDFVLSGIKEHRPERKAGKKTLKAVISAHLPQFVKNLLRDTIMPPQMDGNVLAFRVFIILKMQTLFRSGVAPSGD